MSACGVTECGKPPVTRGYCGTHYQRLRRNGGPTASSRVWSMTYTAVHMRLRASRGRAADLTCRCGAPAKSWAYDHSDPNELREDRGGYLVPFSADLDRYEALCQSCHSEQDHRASHGAPARELGPAPRCGAERTKGRGVCALPVRNGDVCWRHGARQEAAA